MCITKADPCKYSFSKFICHFISKLINEIKFIIFLLCKPFFALSLKFPGCGFCVMGLFPKSLFLVVSYFVVKPLIAVQNEKQKKEGFENFFFSCITFKMRLLLAQMKNEYDYAWTLLSINGIKWDWIYHSRSIFDVKSHLLALCTFWLMIISLV